jgi:hypothetical protein
VILGAAGRELSDFRNLNTAYHDDLSRMVAVVAAAQILRIANHTYPRYPSTIPIVVEDPVGWQRFATMADLDMARCTVDEFEKYDPHTALGNRLRHAEEVKTSARYVSPALAFSVCTSCLVDDRYGPDSSRAVVKSNVAFESIGRFRAFQRHGWSGHFADLRIAVHD